MVPELSSLKEVGEGDRLAVLYVDGDVARRSAGVRSLEGRGHRVVVADTGREALERLAAEPFDSVLVAHALPDASPLDVIRAAVAAHPRLPAILLVPARHEDLEIESLRAGAAETVILSERFPEFLPAVLEHEVGLARALDQLEQAQRAGADATVAHRLVLEQLRESERRFRLAVYQAPMILWTADTDLRVTWAAGAVLEPVGLDPSAIPGRLVAEFFPRDVAAAPVEQHRLARARQSVRVEIPWRDRALGVRLEPIRGERGGGGGVIGIAIDFTDRRRAEEALRLGEERFALLGKATSDMAWDWDLETDRMWRNENLETLFGYAAEDMEPTGAWWELRVHPEDRGRVVQSVHETIGHGDRFWSAEYRWQRKDGEYVTVLDRGFVIRDADGKPVRMVGSTMDITQRRRDEQIREAVYRISEAAVTSRDLPALYAEVHRVVGRLMPAENFYIALHDPETDTLSFPYFVDEGEASPAPYKAGRGLTEYVLRSGKPFYASSEGYERLVSSGEVVRIGPASIDWVGVPLVAYGRTIGVLVVQTYRTGVRYGPQERDILGYVSAQIAMAIERRRAQEALLAAEAKFRSLVEHSLTGIYIIQEGRFRYVNPRLEEVFGYATGEIVASKRVADLVAPEDRARVEENLRGRLSGKASTLHYSFRGMRKDGRRVSIEVLGSAMEFEGGHAIIGSLLDVTERRRAEDDLRRSETRFRTLFEAAADAILLVTARGAILDANPATEALVQMERADLVGASLEEFLGPEDLDRARSYLRDVFRRRSPAEPFEVSIVLSNGLRRYLAVRSRLVSEAGPQAFARMLVRDVTGHRAVQRRRPPRAAPGSRLPPAAVPPSCPWRRGAACSGWSRCPRCRRRASRRSSR